MGDSIQRPGRRRGRLGGAVAALALALGALLLGASPAWAHNSLVEATPAKNATLATPPAQVKLRFLATLKSDGTKLTVTGPDGAAAAGASAVSGKIVSAPFTGTAGGAYTVAYEVLSQDGHLIKGSYKFTLDTAESAAASPVPSPAAPSAAAPSTVAAAPAADTEEQTPWGPWIGGAAVAGLVVGGLISFVRQRRARA
ncbi:copper resistance CopC family protein [Catellatospora sp. IY07-71]|uniref:copper resistance CopC family protein n=1 Tax=Catellatospora sp. IY07-71 TaxID=2728827 RepID=UPI001BB4163C|nr:copper resistance CopC family protein [Catellatospora sp. IY07-71]